MSGKSKLRLGLYYRWLVVQHIGLNLDGDTVLDIGSHDDFTLKHINARIKIGIDLTPVKSDTITLVIGDAQYLPTPDDFFDKIIAFDIIEHIADDKMVMKSIFRVLKEDGQIWLSVPCRSFKVFPAFLTPWLHKKWQHQKHGYLASEIEQLITPDYEMKAVFYWNEPLFRLFYFPLRLLWPSFPFLARKLLHWIFFWDAKYYEGISGHLFVQISKRLNQNGV